LIARQDELGDLLAREEGKTLVEATAAEFPLIGPTFSERGDLTFIFLAEA